MRLKINNPLKEHTLDRFYDKGIDWVFSHKTLSVLFCAISFPLCIFFFYFIDKERMPDIDENELITRIEWNENIHVDENQRRVGNCSVSCREHLWSRQRPSDCRITF